MKYILFVCLSLLIVTACNNKKENYPSHQVDERNQTALEEVKNVIENTLPGDVDSLGYYGVYEGAKWRGAETHKATLTLYTNNRYMIESIDLGNNTRTEEEHGTYLIFGDLLTLTPDENATPRYYNNLQDELTEVDENRQVVVPSYHSTNFRLIKK